MTTPPILIYKLYRYQRKYINSQPNAIQNSGFTLLELLVAALMAGIIVSILLLTTNELIASDRRESAQTETQRDMQTAMDYIGTELKQAVYVYDQACLAETPDEDGNATCSGFFSDPNKINELLPPVASDPSATREPVLTFWKQQPLSDDLKDECLNNPDSQVIEDRQVSCASGHAYTLVVYAYSADVNEGLWEGEGGILRYEMTPTKDNSRGDYVSPLLTNGVDFQGWPGSGKPSFAEPEILVDFVDGKSDVATSCSNHLGGSYVSTSAMNSTVTNQPPDSGFYACVNTLGQTSTQFGNQDVVVYLQGSVDGRWNLARQSAPSQLPLKSQFFIRGVVGRTPAGP